MGKVSELMMISATADIVGLFVLHTKPNNMRYLSSLALTVLSTAVGRAATYLCSLARTVETNDKGAV